MGSPTRASVSTQPPPAQHQLTLTEAAVILLDSKPCTTEWILRLDYIQADLLLFGQVLMSFAKRVAGILDFGCLGSSRLNFGDDFVTGFWTA